MNSKLLGVSAHAILFVSRGINNSTYPWYECVATYAVSMAHHWAQGGDEKGIAMSFLLHGFLEASSTRPQEGSVVSLQGGPMAEHFGTVPTELVCMEGFPVMPHGDALCGT